VKVAFASMSQSDSRGRVDPLFDTLFRPTTVASTVGSDAPVPTVGTHSRAGNAMNRSRAALLAGAARAVRVAGTKITMSQVAMDAGVAKATLYNHFRTRDAVLAALLEHEVKLLLDTAVHSSVERALTTAATELSSHPIVRALATVEPGTLAAIARVDASAAGWRNAREAVHTMLRQADLGGTDIVLRWLASSLLTPGSAEVIAEDVQILLAGLPVLAAVAAPQPSIEIGESRSA
jgi:AcrR family transcriptional regulator